MPIIDIQKRLTEVGRIRMGKKTSSGAPAKIETFRLTSRDQARLTEVATRYGGTVQEWQERPGEYEVFTDTAELPILLLPGQALSLWYELWSAGGCQRRCDGQRDVISEGECVCATEDGDRKCKPTTRLSVMLPDIAGLGVWRLESHGWNAATELSATADVLERATARGQLFPARLRIDQRSEIRDGKTTRFAVPVIDIDVRLQEALGGVSPVAELAAAPDYTPIVEGNGVSVRDGLDAAARQALPAARTARSAEPIGAPADFLNTAPVPVDGDEKPAEPPAEKVPAATQAQKKKLDVLVGRLRDGGHITTEQLYSSISIERDHIDPDKLVDQVGGRDTTGIHWAPLRETLSKPEAHGLIDRLERFEQHLASAAGAA